MLRCQVSQGSRSDLGPSAVTSGQVLEGLTSSNDKRTPGGHPHLRKKPKPSFLHSKLPFFNGIADYNQDCTKVSTDRAYTLKKTFSNLIFGLWSTSSLYFPNKHVLVFNPRICQPGLEMLRPDISRLNVNQMFVHFPYEPVKKLPNLVLCFAIRGNSSSYLTSLSWKSFKASRGKRNDRYSSDRKYDSKLQTTIAGVHLFSFLLQCIWSLTEISQPQLQKLFLYNTNIFLQLVQQGKCRTGHCP